MYQNTYASSTYLHMFSVYIYVIAAKKVLMIYRSAYIEKHKEIFLQKYIVNYIPENHIALH